MDDKFKTRGVQIDHKFKKWLLELNEIGQKEINNFDAIINSMSWIDYYNDGYSPSEAFEEDLTNC